MTIGYDVNSREAEHERELAFGDAAKNGYLIGGAHMSLPGIGHGRSNGKQAYTFAPLNYSSLNQVPLCFSMSNREYSHCALPG